jgi:hypothetical protein
MSKSDVSAETTLMGIQARAPRPLVSRLHLRRIYNLDLYFMCLKWDLFLENLWLHLPCVSFAL